MAEFVGTFGFLVLLTLTGVAFRRALRPRRRARTGPNGHMRQRPKRRPHVQQEDEQW